jgi:hypothetical protein
MTAEVRQQMMELCRQIQTEQDQQKFTQLLERLDLVLSSQNAELQQKIAEKALHTNWVHGKADALDKPS